MVFLRDKVAHFLPFVILLLIVSIIFEVNYSPGTFLTGWDNLHPEFDFFLNIKRSLFAVWQEYQGVGLLGGMGHAADLPRQLILWIASFVLPVHLLRYAWTFAMLLIGPLGLYVLLKRFTPQLPALFGGLFYLLNLATLQTFSVPFEPFVTQFGFLPWLVWSFFLVMEKPSRWTLVVFTIINILAIPQAYVPTIFFVYTSALALLSLPHLFMRRSWKTIALVWIITFCTNAFWLLPFSYFTITKSSVVVNAKINQMATDEVYLRNRAFGTLADTVQLKGFWFDTFDLDPQKNTQVSLASQWQNIANQPFPITLSWIVFSLIIYGAWRLFQSKKPMAIGVVGIFLFAVTLLTTDSQPFTAINDLLRGTVPLFAQVFRFPFTKVAILAGFSYSMLLAIGLASKTKFVVVGGVSTLLLLGIHSLPLLEDRLFYTPLRQAVPQEYFSLFSYLKTKPLGRIASLPQPTYWGWTYARWGHTGSGFLWYGIEQPILDRAFDPWSTQNENYYWDLSRALYSNDAEGVLSVLNKYDVRYVLLDENVISPSNNRALFIDETKTMLGEIGPTFPPRAGRGVKDIREIWGEGKLTLYEVTRTQSNNFVTLAGQLPTVSPSYRWTDNDVAYRELGDYIANEIASPRKAGSGNDTLTYPFRALFTKRSVDEREFTVREDEDSIIIEPPDKSAYAAIRKPENLVFEASPFGLLRPENVVSCGLLRGGTSSAEYSDGSLRFKSLNQRNCLSFGVPDLSHKEGYLVSVESRHITGRPLLIAFINETAKHVELETYLPTTSYFILPPLAPDGLGYSVYLSNDSIGRYETVNDIKKIRFYTFPYNDLVSLSLRAERSNPKENEIAASSASWRTPRNDTTLVDHPNPAYYQIRLQTSDFRRQTNATLILNQGYHDGWTAWEIQCKVKSVKCKVEELLPFLFGREIKGHVLVNNWANAWILKSDQSDQSTNPTNEIVLFFLPQLLQWIGLALLPLPFVWLLIRNHK